MTTDNTDLPRTVRDELQGYADQLGQLDASLTAVVGDSDTPEYQANIRAQLAELRKLTARDDVSLVDVERAYQQTKLVIAPAAAVLASKAAMAALPTHPSVAEQLGIQYNNNPLDPVVTLPSSK